MRLSQGSHYLWFSLSAIFKRTVEQQCTTISIISDECVEDDETFHLQLSTEDESVMLNPATAYVTIHNNDCKFSIDCLVVIEKGSKYRTYRLVARIATCTHTYYAFKNNPYNPGSYHLLLSTSIVPSSMLYGSMSWHDSGSSLDML